MLQLILILICGILSVIVIERLKNEIKRLNIEFIALYNENEKLIKENKRLLNIELEAGLLERYNIHQVRSAGNWDYNDNKHIIKLDKHQIRTLELLVENLGKTLRSE